MHVLASVSAHTNDAQTAICPTTQGVVARIAAAAAAAAAVLVGAVAVVAAVLLGAVFVGALASSTSQRRVVADFI